MLYSFLSFVALHLVVFVSGRPAFTTPRFVDADPAAVGAILGTVNNLRSARGTCYISLYNRKEGFPGKTAVATQKVKLTARECVFTFDKLPKGDYALAAYHDENNNGRFDTNVIGLPTEGFAFSNNARTLMGPPAFADAKVLVQSNRVRVQLKMKY